VSLARAKCITFIYKFAQRILYSDKYLFFPILTKTLICRQIIIYFEVVNNNNISLNGSQVPHLDRQREVVKQVGEFL
jgi:hypothetical protein